MESYSGGKDKLISGIQEDASRKADEIISEAEKRAAEKIRFAEQQAKTIVQRAREKAEQQADAIRRKILSSVGLEVKRRSMQLKEQFLGRVLGMVKEKFKDLMKSEEYRRILENWIVEAMVGLGTEKAKVNASEQERRMIDGKMLERAAVRVKKLTGANVDLSLSGEKPLTSQGIVLTSPDGRTAFNNQVSTRLLRKQREIQSIVEEYLSEKGVH